MQGTIYNDFPAFGCDWARVGPESDQIQVVLLSGGGGATKSGIKNQIQVCKPSIGTDGKPALTELSSFGTGDLVASSVAFSRDGALVAASVDEYDEETVDDGKGGEKVNRTPRGGVKLLRLAVDGTTAKLDELCYFRTDWAEKDSTMAVARFNANASELATGGEDGALRVWSIAAAAAAKAGELGEPAKRLELAGHDEPIVDVDWSPKSDLIVSVAKDTTAKVWRAKDGKLLCETVAQSGGTRDKKTIGKDCFRAARFYDTAGPVGGKDASLRLLTTMCPQRGDTHVVEFAVKGSARENNVTLEPMRTVRLCDHSAAPRCLRISPCGLQVGIGTNGGCMFVLDRISLGTVARKDEACGLPVTMVAFSPPSSEPNILFGCSPDRTCYVLSTAGGKMLQVVLALIILALLIWQFAF